MNGLLEDRYILRETRCVCKAYVLVKRAGRERCMTERPCRYKEKRNVAIYYDCLGVIAMPDLPG
jgi:hypothetical protein